MLLAIVHLPTLKLVRAIGYIQENVLKRSYKLSIKTPVVSSGKVGSQIKISS